MLSLTHRFTTRASACIAIGVIFTACSDTSQRSPAADSALSRDLTLAATVAQPAPELKDVPEPSGKSAPAARERTAPRRKPATPAAPRRAPATTAPASAPTPQPITTPPPTSAPRTDSAEAGRRVGVIAAGTSVELIGAARTCSDGNRPGDKMVMRTSETITGTNGLVFPAGSAAVVEIASVGDNPGADSSRLTFRLKSLTVDGVTRRVTGDVIPEGSLETTRVASSGSDKKKVIGGAIVGAIIGQMIGHNTKGTVIGAAAGGAAGAAAASQSAKYQSCLPAGAKMRLTFASPVEVEM